MKEIHRLEEMARLGNFDDYEVMVYEGEVENQVRLVDELKR